MKKEKKLVFIKSAMPASPITSNYPLNEKRYENEHSEMANGARAAFA